jgi:hypothetical protein
MGSYSSKIGDIAWAQIRVALPGMIGYIDVHSKKSIEISSGKRAE